MADSVGMYQSSSIVLWELTCEQDRVFSHAVNTVKKITPGVEKPPSGDRLRLYGLYKQSMGM
jgi:hypothetical protein